MHDTWTSTELNSPQSIIVKASNSSELYLTPIRCACVNLIKRDNNYLLCCAGQEETKSSCVGAYDRHVERPRHSKDISKGENAKLKTGENRKLGNKVLR